MKSLTAEQRLIIAADFQPTGNGGRTELSSRVVQFAASLEGSNSCIKTNSLLRAKGYDLLSEIRRKQLGTFADLKLIDIGETLATDGKLLREAKPSFLTAMAFAGVDALKRLKGELPEETKTLGVTILTTLNDHDTERMFGCSVKEGVLRFAFIAMKAGLDGLICAPSELEMLRKEFGDKPWLVTPNVRFADGVVAGDDQNPKRAMTPGQTIHAGADCIIMGRPIVQAEEPRAAVGNAVAEIEAAL